MSDTLSPRKIKKITQHIFQLPTLPTTGAKLIELIDNPTTSVTKLSQLIASDQVLAAQTGIVDPGNGAVQEIVDVGTGRSRHVAVGVAVDSVVHLLAIPPMVAGIPEFGQLAALPLEIGG